MMEALTDLLTHVLPPRNTNKELKRARPGAGHGCRHGRQVRREMERQRRPAPSLPGPLAAA